MTNKNRRNPLLNMPCAGALESARLWGWKTGQTFKRHLVDLPPIRKVTLIKGTLYVLEDVFAARYQSLNKQAIRAKLGAYLEDKKVQRSNQRPAQWIGPGEAGKIAGYMSAITFKNHLREMPKIRTKEAGRGRLYELRSVFASFYSEATQQRLDELIIDYKILRTQNRLAKRKIRRRRNENSEKD